MTTVRPLALVISTAPVGAEMRGVGIRALELAKSLSGVADVTLAAIESGGTVADEVPVVTYDHHDPSELSEHIRRADLVVAQPQPPTVMRMLDRSGARLVFDLYDPEILENLELFAARSGRKDRIWLTLTMDRLIAALQAGDHFLCANEAQRDFWLGVMAGARLMSVERHRADPNVLSAISIVPFGTDSSVAEIQPGEGPLERFPALSPADEIVLWNGGVWSWLDPGAAIRAVHEIRARRPGVRLVFMGGSSHPAAREATKGALELATELELLDRVVFFNDRWVPHRHRGSWLCQAHCAISAHGEHLESRFAFRTRILDCFWAGLPAVVTSGDELAARVERDDLGAVARPGDVEGLARGIEVVLDRGKDHYADRLARAAEDYRWEAVTEPLRDYASRAALRSRDPGGRRAPLAVRARGVGYLVARRALNAAGKHDWPRGAD